MHLVEMRSAKPPRRRDQLIEPHRDLQIVDAVDLASGRRRRTAPRAHRVRYRHQSAGDELQDITMRATRLRLRQRSPIRYPIDFPDTQLLEWSSAPPDPCEDVVRASRFIPISSHACLDVVRNERDGRTVATDVLRARGCIVTRPLLTIVDGRSSPRPDLRAPGARVECGSHADLAEGARRACGRWRAREGHREVAGQATRVVSPTTTALAQPVLLGPTTWACRHRPRTSFVRLAVPD